MASSRVRKQVGVLSLLTLSLTLFPACDFVTGVGDPGKYGVALIAREMEFPIGFVRLAFEFTAMML